MLGAGCWVPAPGCQPHGGAADPLTDDLGRDKRLLVMLGTNLSYKLPNLVGHGHRWLLLMDPRTSNRLGLSIDDSLEAFGANRPGHSDLH
jgi:hypothetical protein